MNIKQEFDKFISTDIPQNHPARQYFNDLHTGLNNSRKYWRTKNSRSKTMVKATELIVVLDHIIYEADQHLTGFAYLFGSLFASGFDRVAKINNAIRARNGTSDCICIVELIKLNFKLKGQLMKKNPTKKASDRTATWPLSHCCEQQNGCRRKPLHGRQPGRK
jgi:hypothetical protein